MEYSTFCQGFLPHLTPEDGERVIEEFGLKADFVEVEPQVTADHGSTRIGCQDPWNRERSATSGRRLVSQPILHPP